MPAPARKMDRLLTNKLGFERRMGKHQIYVLKVGGRQVARTLISHGAVERITAYGVSHRSAQMEKKGKGL